MAFEAKPGIVKKERAPLVVMRPISGTVLSVLFIPASVNHKAPSGPVQMEAGTLFGIEVGKKVNTPEVLIREIPDRTDVSHSAPSGPAIMPIGHLSPWLTV
jgi:hypothetical protein